MYIFYPYIAAYVPLEFNEWTFVHCTSDRIQYLSRFQQLE